MDYWLRVWILQPTQKLGKSKSKYHKDTKCYISPKGLLVALFSCALLSEGILFKKNLIISACA